MEETLFQDKKYLMGILTGLILMAIIMVGYDRYQGSQVLVVDEDGNTQNEELVLNGEELENEVNAEIIDLQQQGVEVNVVMTPETPHSPQLERLALILREAGRMLERMDKSIIEINESQTATINQ